MPDPSQVTDLHTESNVVHLPTALAGLVPVAADASQTLQEETTRRLRDLIIEGRLQPGIRLNERELTTQLGISRTPLREATRRLASEGLVQLLPHRGAIVAPIDAAKVQETLQVMGLLEAHAGGAACERASEAEINEVRALHYEMLAARAREDQRAYFGHNQSIHFKIIDCAGNSVLSQLYRALNDQVRRVRYQASVNRERWDQAIAEHELILAALTERDSERVKQQLAHHLANKMGVVARSLAALQQVRA